jgi:hypothetical protein
MKVPLQRSEKRSSLQGILGIPARALAIVGPGIQDLATLKIPEYLAFWPN